jgi:hypothetical protein
MIKHYCVTEGDDLDFEFDFGPTKFELQAGFDPTFIFQLMFDEVTEFRFPGSKHGETIGDFADAFLPLPAIRVFLRKVRVASKKYTGVSLVAWIAYFLAQVYRRTRDSDSRIGMPNETALDKITKFWIKWCHVQSALTLSFHVGFSLGALMDAVFGVRVAPPREAPSDSQPPDGQPPDVVPPLSDMELQAGDDPTFDFNTLKNLFFKMDTIYVLRSTLRVIIALSFVVAAAGTGVSMANALSSATEDPLFKKIGSAKPMDLIGDVINLVNRVVEVCHTGNYSSLFTTDPVLSELNSRYFWFIGVDPTDLDSGVASPFTDKPVFTHEFLKFGETLITDLAARKNLERLKFASNTLRHWTEKLDKATLHLKVITQRNDSLGLHESPYCVLIPGASAIGKSFLWYIFHKVGCLAYGIPSDDSYTYTVNDTHKHWDGFASSMHTLLWDDASCVSLVEGDPQFLGTWLNVAGNNRYIPACAHVSGKGNLRAEFKLIFATSNKLDLQSHAVMLAPEAVLRRFNIVVVPEVKPEFLNDQKVIDGFQKFRALNGRDPESTAEYNFWNFKIYKPSLTGTSQRADKIKQTGGLPDAGIAYPSLEWTMVLASDNLNDVNKFIFDDINEHKAKQKGVLDGAKRVQTSTFDPDTGNLTFQSGEAASLWSRPTFRSFVLFIASLIGWYAWPYIWHAITMVPLGVWFATSVTVLHWFWTSYHDYLCRAYESMIRFFRSACVRVAQLLPEFKALISDAHATALAKLVVSFQILGQSFFTGLSYAPEAQDIIAFVQGSLAMQNFFVQKATIISRLRSYVYEKATGITWKHAAIVTLALFAGYYVTTLQFIKMQVGDDLGPKATWVASTPQHGMTQASRSVSDPGSVVNKILNNVIMVHVGNAATGVKFTNALMLKSTSGGNLCVSTLHSFTGVYPKLGDMDIEIPGGTAYVGPKGGKISDTINLTIKPDRYHTIESSDLIFFIMQGNQCKDITGYFTTSQHRASTNSKSYNVSRAYNDNVHHVLRTANAMLHRVQNIPIGGQTYAINTFVANWDRATEKGCCGSPYIQCDGNATSVVGIHQALNSVTQLSHAVHVTIEDIDDAYNSLCFGADAGLPSGSIELQGSASLNAIHRAFDKELAGIDPARAIHGLQPLASRSVFRQQFNPEDDISGTLCVPGSFAQSSFPPKSKVHEHPFKEGLLRATGLPAGKKEPPLPLKGGRFYEAKRHFIKNVCKIPNTLAPILVATALNGFLVDGFTRLYHPSMEQVKPLTIKESINGVVEGPLAKYMSGIVMSTSAGFPYSKIKTALLENKEPGERTFKPEIYTQIDRIKTAILDQKRPDANDVMFDAHFKDEPISREKNNMAKVRVIIASPLALLIVFRQYILPVIAFISANRMAFETCPSTVVQSFEWTLQRDFVTGQNTTDSHSSADDVEPRIFFDGDYKGWDASLQKILVMCFFRVVHVIAWVSGNYSSDDLRMIVGLSLIICDAAVNFFGDLILFFCFNPSGQPGTAHCNGVINSILFRIGWITVGFCIFQFRRVVKLLVYGDDNWGSVLKTHAHAFNKRTLAAALLPHGVFYTNADKTADITESSDIAKIDFLKRNWVYCHVVKAFLAPLNLETLGGMCCILRTSANATEFDQIRSGMQSLCDEAFYHGEEVFRRICGAVKNYLDSHSGLAGTFEPPSYEYKVKKFEADSEYFIQNRDYFMTCLRK